MSNLERAIAIAAAAHEGAVDKAGQPYILHPLRVMLRVATTEERIAAVLHDVIEDTDWTIDQLREEGFVNDVLEAVDALTKREGEVYSSYVRRAAANPIARVVKLADLADNKDLSRMTHPTGKDLQRLNKYEEAIEFLESWENGIGNEASSP